MNSEIMNKITMEDCVKYFNVGMTVEINDGKIVSISKEVEG